MLLAGPSFEFASPALAPIADEEPTHAPARQAAAVAVAVAPPPDRAPAAMGQAQQLVQLSQFFELLSSWLAMNPGTVPESVLAMLPPDIRRMFKL